MLSEAGSCCSLLRVQAFQPQRCSAGEGTLPSPPANDSAPLCTEKEKDPKYWRDQAQQTLKHALGLQKLNTNVAKNVIMFLGDGEAWGPEGG